MSTTGKYTNEYLQVKTGTNTYWLHNGLSLPEPAADQGSGPTPREDPVL